MGFFSKVIKIVLVVITVFFCLGNINASSTSSWNWDYLYKSRITITNSHTSVTIKSGTQARLTFNHQNLVDTGKSLSSGNDIRVIYWNGSSYTEISRRVDGSWNTTTTVIVFNVQTDINASSVDNNYWLYYGNSSASSPTALTYDLAGYWKFNEGSGTSTSDTSTNGNTATLVNGTAWTTDAKSGGQALNFDKTNDYVDCGNGASVNITDKISVEAWVKQPNATGSGEFDGIAIKTSNDNWNTGYGLYSENNKFRFFINNRDLVPVDATVGEWVHLVGTYDRTSIKLYKNGVVGTPYSYTNAILSASKNLFIGTGPNDTVPAYFFDGKIDEVRIYNRDLKEIEILEHYTGNTYVVVTLLSEETQIRITGITPSSGTNKEKVLITNLAGNGFLSGGIVKLAKSGQTDITATNVTVESPTKITCNIDLNGKTGGKWNVVVTNPDAQSATLLEGFEIKAVEYQVEVDKPAVISHSGTKGEIKLEISENTFEKGVTIAVDSAITLPTTTQSIDEIKPTNVGVEITPSDSNLNYKKAMTLTLEYRDSDVIGINEEKLVVCYYKTRTNKWEVLPSTVDVVNNKVTARIPHLSMFQVMEYFKQVSQSEVKVYPNPFTPTGSDSRFNQVTFKFENTNYEEVEIKIWDVTGRQVKVIKESGIAIVIWDGKDEWGNIVEAGVYVYQIKVGQGVVKKGTIVCAK
jgi:hypothetical protein